MNSLSPASVTADVASVSSWMPFPSVSARVDAFLGASRRHRVGVLEEGNLGFAFFQVLFSRWEENTGGNGVLLSDLAGCAATPTAILHTLARHPSGLVSAAAVSSLRRSPVTPPGDFTDISDRKAARRMERTLGIAPRSSKG